MTICRKWLAPNNLQYLGEHQVQACVQKVEITGQSEASLYYNNFFCDAFLCGKSFVFETLTWSQKRDGLFSTEGIEIKTWYKTLMKTNKEKHNE